MCNKCDEINIAIDRYRRLKGYTVDRQMNEAADRLLAKAEADKAALHPKE